MSDTSFHHQTSTEEVTSYDTKRKQAFKKVDDNVSAPFAPSKCPQCNLYASRTSDCMQMTLHLGGIRFLSKSGAELLDHCDSWIASQRPLPVVSRLSLCREKMIFGDGRRSPIQIAIPHLQYTTMSCYPLLYRVSQEECAKLQESVPYVKVYRYNPKHLCPNLNGYGDYGQRSLKLWQLLHTYWLPNTY